MSFRILLIVGLALLLGACGFHLREQAFLPYATMYVEGDSNSALVQELKRAVVSGGVSLTDQPAQAEAVLQVLSETREKNILSLSGGGRVREFELFYQVSFRLNRGKGGDIAAPRTILLKREMSFNDSQVLAKESEEALLYRDMQRDAVQQILRQVAAVGAK
jgi:LPS-assembly lipoprotein